MALHNNRKLAQEWFNVQFRAVPMQPGIPGPNGFGPLGPFDKKPEAYMTKVALDGYRKLPEAITIDKVRPCTQEEIDQLEGRGIPGNAQIPDDIQYDDFTTWTELKMKLKERSMRLERSINEKLKAEEEAEKSASQKKVKK